MLSENNCENKNLKGFLRENLEVKFPLFFLFALCISIFMLFTLLCADFSTHPVTTEDFTATLMREFFAETIPAFRRQISDNDPIKHFCGFTGIRCAVGSVEAIAYSFETCGRLRIVYIPPTVTRLILRACGQAEVLDCRHFPREAREIVLNMNKYRGRVDLQVLPASLEELHLMSNQLSGPIVLEKLPQALRKLNLVKNKITQDVLYFDTLPPNMEKVDVFNNRITRAAPMGVDTVLPDPAVFDVSRIGKTKASYSKV